MAPRGPEYLAMCLGNHCCHATCWCGCVTRRGGTESDVLHVHSHGNRMSVSSWVHDFVLGSVLEWPQSY